MIAQFVVLFLLVAVPAARAGAGASWFYADSSNPKLIQETSPNEATASVKTLVAAVGPGRRPALAGAEAHHQVRDQNPKGHPIELGMEKFAELVAAEVAAARSRSTLFPGGALGGDQANVSALQGGTLEMASMNAGILASQVKDFAVVRLPVPVRQRRRRPTRVVDGPFGKKLHDKLEEKGMVGLALLGAGLPQPHQQQAADQQGRGHRGPEAARDPEPDQHRLGQGARRQPDADALPRGLRGAGAEGRRRPGEPVHRDRGATSSTKCRST